MSLVSKGVLFLEEGAQGWSETYYVTVGALDEQNVAQAYFGQLTCIIPSRLKLLPASVSVVGLRVSDPTTFRAALFFAPNTNYPTLSAGRATGTYNMPYKGQYGQGVIPNWQNVQVSEVDSAVKLRMEDATAIHRRIFLLRGIPEQITGQDGTYNDLHPYWLPAMQQFRVALTQASVGCLMRVNNPADPAPINVSDLELLATDHRSILLTLPEPLLSAGGVLYPLSNPSLSLVMIRGYRNGYRINGVWTVRSVATGGPPYVYTCGPRRVNCAQAVGAPQGCTAQPFAYTYAPVVNAFDEGLYIVARRTGRPFGLQAGRRRVR
jgi:hypothetical protein